MMQHKNLIVIGHGSKSKEAIEDFDFVVGVLGQKAGYKNVRGAHMEINTPSLAQVVAELYEAGERNMVVVPYFLFRGRHIKQDIPEQIKALHQIYPDISILFGEPIRKEPLMADILIEKAEKVFRSNPDHQH